MGATGVVGEGVESGFQCGAVDSHDAYRARSLEAEREGEI